MKVSRSQALWFITAFSVAAVPQPAFAFGKKKPTALMVVLGDSISAGTLADTRLLFPNENPDLTPEMVAAKSTGEEVNAEVLLQNKSTLSWASGAWIDSHHVRMKRVFAARGQDVKILNTAVPGKQSKDLPRQVKQLLGEIAKGQHTRLEYVLLMMGANDACGNQSPTGAPDDEVHASHMEAYRLLASIKQDAPIRILVTATPDIVALGAPHIRNSHTVGFLTCGFFRNRILNFCNNLVTWETPEQREFADAVVKTKNAIVERASREAAALYPNLDIRFSDRIYRETIEANMLAADCFHPNRDGQQLISDLLWGDQPWF